MAAPISDATVEAWLATGLKEVAIARLQNLSFFLMGFLVCALCIKLLWNFLARDWSFLPRLSYAKATGVVFMWCLLFVLVLTMIAGARELMTPGAWEQHGITYQLKKNQETESLEQKREQQILLLKAALWQYAAQHDGQLPDDLSTAGVAKEARSVPDPSRMEYVYIKGLKAGQGDTAVLLEPDIFSSGRFVLFTSGSIRRINGSDLQQASAQVKP
jgi:hypothetical protein